MPEIVNPVTGTRASVSERQLASALAAGWRSADVPESEPTKPAEEPKAPARRRSKPKTESE